MNSWPVSLSSLPTPMIPDATDWSNLQFQLFHVCILHMFMAIKGQLNLFYSCGGLLLQVFISHEWATWLSFFAWWRAKGSVHEYRLDFNVGRRFFVLPVRPWSKAYQSKHWLAYSVWWNRFSMAFNYKYEALLFCQIMQHWLMAFS